MQSATGNIPYVKQFDKNGKLTNPIKDMYVNYFGNRSQNRKQLRGRIFKNNKASTRGSFVQIELTKSYTVKQIRHIA
jgi:hypothetical protein